MLIYQCDIPIDKVSAQAVIVGAFNEERPLQGAAGLLDWRLNGWLSRLIAEDQLHTQWGEQCMLPLQSRLGFERLVFLGLGSQNDYNAERFEAFLERILQLCGNLKLSRIAVDIPIMPPITHKDAQSSISSLKLGELSSEIQYWIDSRALFQ